MQVQRFSLPCVSVLGKMERPLGGSHDSSRSRSSKSRVFSITVDVISAYTCVPARSAWKRSRGTTRYPSRLFAGRSRNLIEGSVYERRSTFRLIFIVESHGAPSD